MDPNETLKQLREFAKAEPITDEHGTDMFYDLSALVISLDEWLSSGGFLPDDWAQR